jgi:flagellum-specific peptidoglycan hydrolase FlgJ
MNPPMSKPDRKQEIIETAKVLCGFFHYGLNGLNHSPIPWQIIAAQAALESRDAETLTWGGSKLARIYNNFMGYTWTHGCNRPWVELPTQEEVDGRMVKATRRFCVYFSLRDSLDHAVRTLLYSGNYTFFQRLLCDGRPLEELIEAIGSVYATDSNYAQKVKKIMVKELGVVFRPDPNKIA